MNTNHKYKAFFEKSTPDYDPELLWDNIEPHLPKKEKRRPVFFLLLVGLMVGAIVYLFNNDPLTASKQEIYTPSTSVVEVLKPVAIIDAPGKGENMIKSLESNPSKGNSQIEIPRPLIKGLDKPISVHKNSIAKTSFGADLRKADLEIIEQKNTEVSNKPSIGQQTEITSSRNIVVSSSDIRESQVDYLIAQGKPCDDHLINNRAITVIERLNSNHLLQIVQDTFVGHSLSVVPSLPHLESVVFKSSFFVTSNTSIGFTTSIINPLVASSDKYVQFKKDHERPVENFGFNLLFGFKKYNFSIATGLHYDRITEIFTADDLTISKYSIISDSALYLENSNAITYFSGNREVTQTTGRIIKSPNTVQRWSIPIRLGYEIELTAKMKLNLTTGINLNFVNLYEGITVDQGLNFIYKDRQKLDQVYKNSGVHAWMGGVSVQRRVSKRLWLGLGLEVQSDLTSQLSNDWSTSQKYNFYRMNLNASYLVF